MFNMQMLIYLNATIDKNSVQVASGIILAVCTNVSIIILRRCQVTHLHYNRLSEQPKLPATPSPSPTPLPIIPQPVSASTKKDRPLHSSASIPFHPSLPKPKTHPSATPAPITLPGPQALSSSPKIPPTANLRRHAMPQKKTHESHTCFHPFRYPAAYTRAN